MNSSTAAVFILLGQSNAVGHGLPMRPEDRIEVPLKNVFGLSRDLNQSFHNTQLDWSGYTSAGMNLAETQDHTYSVANCLAALWQAQIDNGAELPDLYIIQIAIGAEGVLPEYMWHPDYEKQLIPGKLGTVKISLFPYCMHIFSLLGSSFQTMGKDYRIIGLHWRGGENDTYQKDPELAQKLKSIYIQILDSFNQVLGDPPVVLHILACPDRMMDRDPTGFKLENMHQINQVFLRMQERYSNVSLFDVRKAPYFVPNVRGNGIFKNDMVHFTEEVNRWVADCILKQQL